MAESCESGGRAAAVLLSLVAKEDAVQLVDALDPVEVQRICSAMEAMGHIGEDDVDRVLADFIARARASNDVAAHGERAVRSAIESSLGPQRARSVIGKGMAQDHPVFRALRWLGVEDVRTLVENEHPQLVAIVIGRVDPAIAARALADLDEARRVDLLQRAATAEPLSVLALDDLLHVIEHLQRVGTPEPVESGGCEAVAAILNHGDRSRTDRDIKALAKRDRKLAAEIDNLRVVFDDLMTLSDKDLGVLVRQADTIVLAHALDGVTATVADRFLGVMSKRASQTLRDELQEITGLAATDRDAARATLVALARRLSDDGAIVMGGARD